MKSTLLIAISIVVCLPGVLFAQFVQDPEDLLAADTADMVLSLLPYSPNGQNHVRADLYVFCDALNVCGAGLGFSWDNPDLQMDSALISPEIASYFGLFKVVYYQGILDSTNVGQRFLCAVGVQNLPVLPASPTRRLWASYFFTVHNWDAADSAVIDTLIWGGGTPFRIYAFTSVPGRLTNYSPYWTGPKVIRDKAPSCCVLRTGDANCSGGDEPTISDIQRIVDFLFVSRTPLCCIPEADVNQSGGANPTVQSVTISDINYLNDYLFITGPSRGLPNCY